MCVTEKWVYRECGCHYNHNILCSTYRRNRGPNFSPNIQQSVDQWLEETGTDTDTAAKQLRRRARPADPQECPQHTTVEKSFLNQICEDCLLAELDPKPPDLQDPTAPASPVPTPDNGEGLIWDSEVKVEIQSEDNGPIPRPTTPDVGLSDVDSHSDDQRILESHIEVKIEVDCYSNPVEVPSSPLSLTADDEASSQSCSIPTSPTSPAAADNYSPVSSLFHNKRYGLTFHSPVVADLNDADDEFDSSPERYYHFPAPPSRGRSFSPRNLNRIEHYAPSAESSPLPVEGSSNGSALLRVPTFRSSSNNITPMSKTADKSQLFANHSSTSLPLSSVSTKLRSRNPFRGFGTRKASPLITDTIECRPVLLAHGCVDTSDVPISRQRSGRTSPLPPRKSSLKNWTFFKLHHDKQGAHPRSQSRLRSLAPSPTGSWSRNQLEHDEKMYSQLSDSGSEFGSEIGMQEDHRQVNVLEEPTPLPVATVSKPPARQTGLAIIDSGMTLDAGLEEGARIQMQSHLELAYGIVYDSDIFQHDSLPAWPVYPQLRRTELERPDSWPLRSEIKQEDQARPQPSVHPMRPRAVVEEYTEELSPMDASMAEESVQPDRALMPLLRPEQVRAEREAKRPTFPPRKSSLRTRFELRRSKRLSEFEVPVPALTTAS
ncbi:hypothetical protein A1O1_01175 [Capronia coronata CBS 617.96]|uniref:Uncharacterized protein n=1 Tax=Capronia coronata CBS 617.96 TaxID=1182541 RepID=W9ZNJ4_9EURO|nr:uncharacterized protein A1O1_01175 [Capronia coronata CBS 617.96]EXJ96049.1 hypothetical protein A1O1_01175 [Capronia coronata CBS 617.96]